MNYEQKKQREFDKLYETYSEEGVTLPPGRFPISHFFACRMVRHVKKQEFREIGINNCNYEYYNLYAPDLVDTEVAPMVVVTKENSRYYLEYEDMDSIIELIDYWLNIL